MATPSWFCGFAAYCSTTYKAKRPSRFSLVFYVENRVAESALHTSRSLEPKRHLLLFPSRWLKNEIEKNTSGDSKNGELPGDARNAAVARDDENVRRIAICIAIVHDSSIFYSVSVAIFIPTILVPNI